MPNRASRAIPLTPPLLTLRLLAIQAHPVALGPVHQSRAAAEPAMLIGAAIPLSEIPRT